MTELHGGNIYRLAEALAIDENEIVDFSASINPLGVPESVISAIKGQSKYLFNYPDPDAKQLIQAIAKHLGINPQSLICGNGSTELIYLIARALRPERALIPAPTFSEYERAVKNQVSGIRRQVPEIEYLFLKKEDNFDITPENFISALTRLTSRASCLTPCNMAFLCNPNNPTGRLIKKADMLKIADTAKKLKCYLVVDEAFIDFLPEESIAGEVEGNPYLIVLRSMTKFYALSGLRIGYCAARQSVLNITKEYKEPWTVNTLAQKAGLIALNDAEYKNKTFRIMKQEKQFMEDSFKKLKIDFIPSSVNYYLIRLNNAREIIHSLRDKGILVRDCSNFIGLDGSYVRVAVKSRRENKAFIKALQNFLDVIPAKLVPEGSSRGAGIFLKDSGQARMTKLDKVK